jgi:hypothetical protein
LSSFGWKRYFITTSATVHWRILETVIYLSFSPLQFMCRCSNFDPMPTYRPRGLAILFDVGSGAYHTAPFGHASVDQASWYGLDGLGEIRCKEYRQNALHGALVGVARAPQSPS